MMFRGTTRALMARLWSALALVASIAAPAAAQSVPVITEYYHVDALGSVRVVANEAGVVQRTYDYDPFGVLENGNCGQAQDPQLYTGQEHDNETCLEYFGARHYRATSGRFLGIDPALDKDKASADPQRWNRYAYGRNNPNRYVDPDGKDWWDIGLDQISLGISLYNVYQDPSSIWNWVGLGLDVVGQLPVVPAAGWGVRAVGAADVISQSNQAERGVGFIVTEAGEAIPVPAGAVGPTPVRSGKGFMFEGGAGGNGLHPSAAEVRIMDPTPPRGRSPGYPNGYVTYGDASGYGINPYTGQQISNADPLRHIALKPKP